jgi:hypothetical protein
VIVNDMLAGLVNVASASQAALPPVPAHDLDTWLTVLALAPLMPAAMPASASRPNTKPGSSA